MARTPSIPTSEEGSAGTKAIAQRKPVDAAVLFNGPRVATTSGLTEFLGGLMVDLRNGDVDPRTAGVLCDVSGKLIKAMELQYRIERTPR